MVVLIFAKNREKGVTFFEELIGNLKYKDVKRVCKSLHRMYAELYNGDIYELVYASDSSRGRKCDKVYISNEIDIDIVNQVIRPCLIVSNLPEEEQIVFF